MSIRWLLVVVLFASQAASAQVIYRWVDTEGVMHFTDDPASIPPKFRASASTMPAKELGVVLVKDTSTSEPPAGPGETAKPSVAPAPDDRPSAEEEAAQSERKWRGAFKTLNRRIEELESSLVAERKRLETAANLAYYNAATGMYVSSGEADLIKEKIRKAELELKQAQEELQDLEREASRNSIPREWRR